jgi:hypothetical protein
LNSPSDMLARSVRFWFAVLVAALSAGCAGHAAVRSQIDSAGLRITFALDPARVSAANHLRVTVEDAQHKSIEIKSIIVHLVGPSGPTDANAGIVLANDNDGGYAAGGVRLPASGEWSAIVSIDRLGAPPLRPTFGFTARD